MMFSQWFGKWDSSIEHSAREGEVGGRLVSGEGNNIIVKVNTNLQLLQTRIPQLGQ